MTNILDAHQHFWQLSLPFDYGWLDAPHNAPIRRDFLPEHLEPHLRTVQVSETIFVQTQHNLEESRWVLGLADKYPFIAGVVGWVDLASADCEQQVLEFKKHPKFVGVRHITQDEPDDDFIVRPDVLRGLKILQKHRVPFDLLFYVKHLRHVPALAQQLADLPMVIDHLAKPNIKDRRLEGMACNFPCCRGVPQCLLQALGHDYRSGLERVETRRFGAVCSNGPGMFRPATTHVRLRLAGV